MADYTLVESKTEADASDDVITFAGKIAVIQIWHSETADAVFTVNGIDINVPPDILFTTRVYEGQAGATASAEVTIPTGITACIVNRLF